MNVILVIRIIVKIVKNKVAPPFRQVELDLLFSEGISKELELLDAAIEYNVIVQSGSWFSLMMRKLLKDESKRLQFLKTNKECF